MKRAIIACVLGIGVILLGWYLWASIMKPIDFEKAKKYRYDVTIARLKDIRTAQVAYRSEHQKFTGSFDTLINFIKTGNFHVIRRIGSDDDSVAVAQGLVKRDTILMPVRDSLFAADYPVDSLRYVPFTRGKYQFELAAGQVETASKVVIPVFQAQCSNRMLLNGLNHQYIVNLDDMARQLERYPGLRVGSITEATNNAGNWE